MSKPENPMLWEVEPFAGGYDTSKENLENVLRQIDRGRVDLARSLLLSMIGRKLAEETLLDGKIN